MRLFPPLCALALALSPTGLATVAQTPSDPTAFQRWYEALRDAEPDPSRGATVENLALTKDAGRLELLSGELHLLRPIDGRTVGAVFVGQGRFTMTAPISVERERLERFYGADSLTTEIETAVLFFTDGTDAELAGRVSWGERPPPSNARREVEEALKYVSDDDGWISRDFMNPLLNDVPGFFYAHVAESRGRPTIFTIDPLDAEEVSLFKRATGRGLRREVVSQFHQEADYVSGRSIPQEALDQVRVFHYDVESTIKSNLDYSGRTAITVQRLADDNDWIPFRLYSDLEVDSVIWGNGTPASHYRTEEAADLWIDFSSAPADSTQLVFYYQGELFERFRDLWVVMRSTTSWFPTHAFWRPATYRLAFRAHKKYNIVAVGSLVEESGVDDDDMVSRVWETPVIRQATFNIGEFEDHYANDPRIPSLRVQVDENAHRSLGAMAADANLFLLRQRDMAEMVTTDLANSFAFFDQVFGPTPVSEFTATEIPFSHGEAYPGLVLLSWTTFQWTSSKGFDDMFRAHEVAHQWWGIGVQPSTYHDRWLSEGFSEFAGLWYTARGRGSIEIFIDRLKETREAILDRRDDAAPIWLGTRVGTSEYPGDYQTIVYHKGAWVLHMLRGLFTNAETGDDQAFENMMRDFYTTYYGQTATTEQFQAVVERHAGIPMDWFFNQWVYGSAIPTYRFSYKLDEVEGGEFKTTVRIRQEDVSDDFRMIVPILLDFGAAGQAVVKVDVRGPVTETELPLLPMRPERIEFNPVEAVLADTKTEGWRN